MPQDNADRSEAMARAVEALLARVPVLPPAPPASTRWVECDRGKTNPLTMY
jgi:hypothetical protein